MFFEFALIGVTASGKSKLANSLALEFDAIVLSLDSLAVYKEISIASAKPSKEQRKNISYFGLDLISIKDHFNIALYCDEYKRAKQRAINEQRPLIIAGGSSFYLHTLLSGLSPRVNPASSYPKKEDIYAMMKESDKGAKIEANDIYRLCKWYDIYASGEKEPSVFLKQNLQDPLIKQLDIFELVVEKEKLLEKIAIRTKQMIDNGLIDEARYLFANFSKDLKALGSIGIKECKDFLCGLMCEQELFNKICQNTAKLAKKQRTFNKKFKSKSINEQDGKQILRKYMQTGEKR